MASHINEDMELRSNASEIRNSARRMEKQYTWHQKAQQPSASKNVTIMDMLSNFDEDENKR